VTFFTTAPELPCGSKSAMRRR